MSPARPSSQPPLLECTGLDVGYGQVQVLFDVDFSIAEGEMVALLGTNGAGKSTLLKAISGVLPPRGGSIVFDGKDITKDAPQATAAAGVVQAPGGKGVFPTLTVGENLRAASWLFRKNPKHVAAAVPRALDMFPILRKRYKQPAGNMSGGEQQMLTLAQAFLAEPKLLLIDELSLGLAPTIVEQLLETVRAVHASGVTIALVEQSVNVALTVCQRAVFLEKGEVRFEGPTADLLERPDVLRSVFLQGASAVTGAGNDTSGSPSARPPATTRARLDVERARELGVTVPVLLEADSLVKRYGGITAVDHVSFRVHGGEILGLVGSNGAGKTTIFDLLSGFTLPDEGRVLLDGQDVTDLSPDLRSRERLGRSFQDAKLFPGLTVRETIATSLERHLTGSGLGATIVRTAASQEQERRIADKVDELVELMGLTAFYDKFIGELSTGSRRIVDLACCLAHEPRVLLLDEPSSGIAQKETEALGPLLLKVQQATGCSLLVIEHDMPLLTTISDRMVALEQGAEIAAGTPDEVLANPRVIASYLGTDETVIARSGSLESSFPDDADHGSGGASAAARSRPAATTAPPPSPPRRSAARPPLGAGPTRRPQPAAALNGPAPARRPRPVADVTGSAPVRRPRPASGNGTAPPARPRPVNDPSSHADRPVSGRVARPSRAPARSQSATRRSAAAPAEDHPIPARRPSRSRPFDAPTGERR